MPIHCCDWKHPICLWTERTVILLDHVDKENETVWYKHLQFATVQVYPSFGLTWGCLLAGYDCKRVINFKRWFFFISILIERPGTEHTGLDCEQSLFSLKTLGQERKTSEGGNVTACVTTSVTCACSLGFANQFDHSDNSADNYTNQHFYWHQNTFSFQFSHFCKGTISRWSPAILKHNTTNSTKYNRGTDPVVMLHRITVNMCFIF